MFRLIVATLVAFALAPASALATPTARFTWSPNQPQTGQTVTFDGTTSSCDRAPCTYTWDDSGGQLGATPACQNSSCTVLTTSFNFTGTKNPRLTVRNKKGQTNAVTHTIDVVAAPPPPTLLWTADADTPGSWDVTDTDPGPEWASDTERAGHPWMIQRVCPTLPSPEVRQGNCSYRFETRPGDYGTFDADRVPPVVRAELAMGNPTRAGFEYGLEQPGSDVYYGFYVKRTAYPVGDGVEAMMQDKTIAPSGAPLFETYSTDRTDGLYVSFNNWFDDSTRVELGMGMHPEPVGDVWYRYVIHLKHLSYPNGVIQVWFGPDNGQPLTQIVNKTDAHMSSTDGRPAHIRIGIYGSDSVPLRVSYIDGFKAGTSYDDVVPQ